MNKKRIEELMAMGATPGVAFRKAAREDAERMRRARSAPPKPTGPNIHINRWIERKPQPKPEPPKANDSQSPAKPTPAKRAAPSVR